MAKKYKKLTVWEDEYSNMIHIRDEAGNIVKQYYSTSQWNNAKRFAVQNAEEAYTRGYNFREPTRIDEHSVTVRVVHESPKLSTRKPKMHEPKPKSEGRDLGGGIVQSRGRRHLRLY